MIFSRNFWSQPAVELDGFHVLEHFVLELAELLVDLVSFVVLVAEAVVDFLVELEKEQEKRDSDDEGAAEDH